FLLGGARFRQRINTDDGRKHCLDDIPIRGDLLRESRRRRGLALETVVEEQGTSRTSHHQTEQGNGPSFHEFGSSLMIKQGWARMSSEGTSGNLAWTTYPQ